MTEKHDGGYFTEIFAEHGIPGIKAGAVKKIHGDPLDDILDETRYGYKTYLDQTSVQATQATHTPGHVDCPGCNENLRSLQARESGRFTAALYLACHLHAGQVDKAGEPYILHPIRVALRVVTPEERIVALLHDVIEDCPEGAYQISEKIDRRFGRRVLNAVQRLTRINRSYADYIRDVAVDRLARRVKIADLQDNLDPHRPGDYILPLEKRTRYQDALAALLRAEAGEEKKRSVEEVKS